MTIDEANIPNMGQKTGIQSSYFVAKLPAELRNRVYHLVLVFDEEIIINTRVLRGQRSLLQVCTQIRREASQIYYAKNNFRIPQTYLSQPKWLRATNFLNAAGSQNVRHIPKLSVTFQFTSKQSKLFDGAIQCLMLHVEDDKNKPLQALIKDVEKTTNEFGSELAGTGIARESVAIERLAKYVGHRQHNDLYNSCAEHFEEAVLKHLAVAR